MSEKSKIEWTDATWNPVRGCTKVSPGCTHCYAETFAERWRGIPGHPYEQGFDLRLVPEKLDEPLHWRKPRRVFVNSMSDLFHEDVPDEFIVATLGVIAASPLHTFQILTKRPERMADVCSALTEAGGLGKYIRSDNGRNSLRDLFGAVQRTEQVYGKIVRTIDDPWMKVMNAAAFNW
jgi:protein gp37